MPFDPGMKLRRAFIRVRWREAVAGAAYRVEYSDALANSWQSFPGVVSAGTRGVVEYLDAAAAGPAPAKRFYRLVTPS